LETFSAKHSTSHFLHMYSLDFYLKKSFLPSSSLLV
jgi:hypothetical protein